MCALARDASQKTMSFHQFNGTHSTSFRGCIFAGMGGDAECGFRKLGSFHNQRCSMETLPPRPGSLPDLVQAPSRLTMFKCGPRWVIIFSSDMRACFSLDLAVAVKGKKKKSHITSEEPTSLKKLKMWLILYLGISLLTKSLREKERVPWSGF